MIDGRTRLVGLIGWPVEHSLSPLMHNAAFDELGLNWRYLPFPVPPDRVEAAVRGLVALGIAGVNVTVPHKQAAMPVLDRVAGEAQALGAVNTIVTKRSLSGRAELSGHNTDHAGFLRALRNEGFEPAAGGAAVIIGAGGAARAVVYSLIRAGMGRIVVMNRTPGRARSLVNDLDRHRQGRTRLQALPFTHEQLADSAQTANLLVNATSKGMWPQVDESIWPEKVPMPSHLTVYDLVYNPLETRLLAQARTAGAETIDGLGMLVAQGAIAFELWTGQPAPEALMRAACEVVLRR